MKLVVESEDLREAIENAMREMADAYDSTYMVMRLEAPSIATVVLWRLGVHPLSHPDSEAVRAPRGEEP